MKRYLSCFLVVLLCFVLVGCGCSKKENTNTNEEEIVDLKLYTTDNKLVYKNDNTYKLVFYYEGDKITGYEHYYAYADIEAAKNELTKKQEELKYNNTIKEIKRINNYVVFVMAESEYKDETVTSVQEKYSYLVPVYEK